MRSQDTCFHTTFNLVSRGGEAVDMVCGGCGMEMAMVPRTRLPEKPCPARACLRPQGHGVYHVGFNDAGALIVWTQKQAWGANLYGSPEVIHVEQVMTVNLDVDSWPPMISWDRESS